MRLGEPDEVEFIFLAFAQTAARVPVGPELALRNVWQAGDSNLASQNLGFDGSGQKELVSFVGGELNPQFAPRCLRQ